MPQRIAGGTRFVLPPQIVAPPPPFPISGVVVQPYPILYVYFVDLSMGLFQVRVYLLIDLSDLGSYYGAESFLQKRDTFLTNCQVFVYLGDRKLHFAIFAFRSVPFRFLCHFLLRFQVRKFIPAEWTSLLPTLFGPLLDTVDPKHMPCCALTIHHPRMCHELQANTAKQMLMTLLVCYQRRRIHTISHQLLHNLSILFCLSAYKRITCMFLLISIDTFILCQFAI